MITTSVIELSTPKGVSLAGLWSGPKHAKHVFIFIHGLTGSAFSMRTLAETLVSRDTAVLTFNNRGHGEINSVKRRIGKKTRYLLGGSGHEIFTDCVDDIDGAIGFAKKNRAKRVYLVGHSTGAQKAMYWASKKGTGVHGIMLLGPLSDYAGALKAKGPRALAKGVATARALIAASRPHALMPEHTREWFECDAQRYISLYTPDSAEEIFSYAQPKKNPAALKKVRIPTLVCLAGEDEYGDRPPHAIAEWFASQLQCKNRISVIKGVGHAFKGGEKRLAQSAKVFLKDALH